MCVYVWVLVYLDGELSVCMCVVDTPSDMQAEPIHSWVIAYHE